MSARVFNRFAMSEARAPRGPPPGQQIETARRVLFGEAPNCNQAMQARQVAANELADSLKQKSQLWNFDFSRGVPLDNADSRLKWSKQEQSQRVPEAYAHEKLPYLSTHADSGDREVEISTPPCETTKISSKQSSITDFMPKRKSSVTAGCSKTSSASSEGVKATTVSVSEPPKKKHKTSSS